MNQGNLNVNQNNEANNNQVVNNGMNRNINVVPNIQSMGQTQTTSNSNIVNTDSSKATSSVVNASNNTVNVKINEPKKEEISDTVVPTETVINTGNKKTISVIWFLLVIAMGAFIYYIDDILAYFNQNFTPVIKDDKTSESGSDNLVDGFIKIDTTNSYIKLKGIRFNNVKKGNNNSIFISYVSDKNYTASLPLGIVIEIYDQNKEKIYNEDFNVFGSIESNKARQYKLSLEENIYNNAYYCLIKTK